MRGFRPSINAGAVQSGAVTRACTASCATSASAEATREPHVILLVHDLDVRVIDAATGELLRELVINPNRDYQPTGAPRGPTRTTPK